MWWALACALAANFTAWEHNTFGTIWFIWLSVISLACASYGPKTTK